MLRQRAADQRTGYDAQLREARQDAGVHWALFERDSAGDDGDAAVEVARCAETRDDAAGDENGGGGGEGAD